tara:strand:- start:376 stop:765 length:390 start_codon:yes stop_codon:yes gene_type:complete
MPNMGYNMSIDNTSKERFLEAKKKVTKKYPGAKTMRDHLGKYFVATSDGRDINNLQVSQAINTYAFDDESDLLGFNAALNKIATVPHSNSIKEAWLRTEVAIKSYHVVNRNSNKFSDDKVMKKMARDFE